MFSTNVLADHRFRAHVPSRTHWAILKTIYSVEFLRERVETRG